MKSKLIIIHLCGALLAAILVAGCSKSGANHGAMAPEKIPGAINQAFGTAPEEIKEAATNCVAAFQEHDSAVAFAQLRKMSAEDGLTPAQRTVVAKAMQTTLQQLQAAAQNGNPAAQSAMHQYLSTR